MKDGIIIFGSSRSQGDTRKVVDYCLDQLDFEFVDLNEYQISYYDYEHRNKDDDFMPLFERVAQHHKILFATPVYWYTMSAVMKTFFDRITDVLRMRRPLKKSLAGKGLASLSCSNADDLIEGFHRPFEETAGYLKMEYLGGVHAWVEEDAIAPAALPQLDHFLTTLKG